MINNNSEKFSFRSLFHYLHTFEWLTRQVLFWPVIARWQHAHRSIGHRLDATELYLDQCWTYSIVVQISLLWDHGAASTQVNLPNYKLVLCLGWNV